MNPLHLLGLEQILACAVSATTPNFGIIVKELKECVNESAFGSIYFDDVISVHEGSCKVFAGMELGYMDYDPRNESIGEEIPFTLSVKAEDTFIPTNNKAENTIFPTKDKAETTIIPTNDKAENTFIPTKDNTETTLIPKNDKAGTTLIPVEKSNISTTSSEKTKTTNTLMGSHEIFHNLTTSSDMFFKPTVTYDMFVSSASNEITTSDDVAEDKVEVVTNSTISEAARNSTNRFNLYFGTSISASYSVNICLIIILQAISLH